MGYGDVLKTHRCTLLPWDTEKVTFPFHFKGISKGNDKLEGELRWKSRHCQRLRSVEGCGGRAWCVGRRGNSKGVHRKPPPRDCERVIRGRAGTSCLWPRSKDVLLSWVRCGPEKVMDPEHRALYPIRPLLPGLTTKLRAGELSMGSDQWS